VSRRDDRNGVAAVAIEAIPLQPRKTLVLDARLVNDWSNSMEEPRWRR
jgi:hypothetical protein